MTLHRGHFIEDIHGGHSLEGGHFIKDITRGHHIGFVVVNVRRTSVQEITGGRFMEELHIDILSGGMNVQNFWMVWFLALGRVVRVSYIGLGENTVYTKLKEIY
jgi:hypothetical protein